MTANALTFAEFRSFIDVSFWSALSERKLHEWKLDETPRQLCGTFDNSEVLEDIDSST